MPPGDAGSEGRDTDAVSAANETLKHLAKVAFWSAVPLPVRKRAAVGISRAGLIGHQHRLRLSMLAVGDLAVRDNREFHKFLWSNHLAYAIYYAAEERFRTPIEESRLELFADLLRHLEACGCDPDEIDSVLDVGCSVGANLRHLEQHVFPSARNLDGIDIDSHAVQNGRRVLEAAGSSIRLMVGELEQLDPVLADRTFDVVLCAGVLLYLDQARAAEAVAAMLRRTRKVCAFAAVAHPDLDNRELSHSVMRAWDSSHIHNVDAMVDAAGGRVVGRRWERGTIDGRQSIYFVFAAPPA